MSVRKRHETTGVSRLRIGYACINTSIGCTSSSTFRLKSYTEERLIESIQKNLDCLEVILEYNLQNNVLFFRITSDLVPFASHPICTYNWQDHFNRQLRDIGRFAKSNGMRLSMHPGQYTVLNSNREEVLENSIRELEYHTDILDLIGMDTSAKIQIHVGGVYGDKTGSLRRFITNYQRLDDSIVSRLVIENDEKSYTLSDCLSIHKESGIPVVFDTLHHEVKNNGESIIEALDTQRSTWNRDDGIPIVHYSSQEPGNRPGKHAEKIDTKNFARFLEETCDIDFDLMLDS